MEQQSHKAQIARAVVLYGRVGTYHTRTASLKKGMPGDEGLWRSCALSIQKFVVAPWRAAGRVDIFVQSWNPELGAAMDEFWQPERSYHAAQNTSIGRCPVKLQYCDRTMWALNGMKRALALRMGWAHDARADGSRNHATVMVMRHDVLWSGTLPPLRADRSVRLWLPFDCHRAACRDSAARASDLYAEQPEPKRPPAASCSERKNAPPSNWTMLLAPRSVLGVNCDRPPPAKTHFCGNSVNIDWWWAGDTALADGFGSTFDNFGEFSRLVKEHLNFHNSAPHHYWGLYFFHKHRLREKCQLGHAGVSGVDFTLGRFVPAGSSLPNCRMQGWRAYWKPPSAAKGAFGGGSNDGGGGSICNASLIPGYLTMCPGTPTHPVRRVCGAVVAENASVTKLIHKLQKRGGDSGGGGGAAGGANTTRMHRGKGGGAVAAAATAATPPPRGGIAGPSSSWSRAAAEEEAAEGVAEATVASSRAAARLAAAAAPVVARGRVRTPSRHGRLSRSSHTCVMRSSSPSASGRR